MKNLQYIAYRYLTDADFFNINKPIGTEPSGGGQAYIDFKTSVISIDQWHAFFEAVEGVTLETRGTRPRWTVPIGSIGFPTRPEQSVTIYQRREASVCIAAQLIGTEHSNRVNAWLPENGFPYPDDPSDRQQLPDGLVVFLARTYDGEIWAGWFLNTSAQQIPSGNSLAYSILADLISPHEPGDVGILQFEEGTLSLNELDQLTPFIGHSEARPIRPSTESRQRRSRAAYRGRRRTDDQIAESLFDDDEDPDAVRDSEQRSVVLRIRRRNERAVRDLKELYNFECQLTGTSLTFQKPDGTHYTEAHHLEPLGAGGADDPRNIIIVSPLIHRMLHYAEVSGVDLANVQQHPDGSATLQIEINQVPYLITWHPLHAERVLEH